MYDFNDVKSLSHTGMLALMAILLTASSASGQSELWGEKGVAWQPGSILPEFAFAGYHRGDRPVPRPEPEASVKDFGAVGDGERDDTEAFRRAITESAGKAIRIPTGIYVLSDRLDLFDAGTSLIGDGMDQTILLFTRGLQEIEPTSATTGGGLMTNSWSWSGGLIRLGKSGGTGGAQTTVVTSEAKRGESTFEVENPEAFQAGDAALLRVTDTGETSLLNHIYRGRPGDISRFGSSPFSLSQAVTVSGIEGNLLTIDQRLRFDLRSEWTPVVSPHRNQSQEIGIADFTIRFPARPYRGHWMEDGLNGFEMRGVNNWARDIRIQNCDSGVFVSGAWCTIEGLTLESEREAHDSGNTGHHGISVQGGDCLITNFAVNTQFFHDITVSSNSIGNVISKGRGVDLSLDHHRAAPYENLFTEIHLGEGTRVWTSGGSGGKGLHTASGATFWNLDSKNRFDLPDEGFGPPGIIFVGVNSGSVRSSDLPEGWHYERLRPGSLDPPNLHQAQWERRQGGNASPNAPSPDGAYHSWTNTEGNALEAKFRGLESNGVALETRDGRRFVYPLEKLSPESQELASRLGE